MNRRQKIGKILAADIVAGTSDLNSAGIWIDQTRFSGKFAGDDTPRSLPP